jgi:hypothetical protein
LSLCEFIYSDELMSLREFIQQDEFVQIGVLQFVSPVQIYAKSSHFYAKLNVLNLYVTNLY